MCRAQGTVTQVTDVKPLLTVATYLDANQATEAYQEVSGELQQPRCANSAEHAECAHNACIAAGKRPTKFLQAGL